MEVDKQPVIVESALTNGGERTVVESDLAKGANAPPHYHTDFTETFTLVSGEMTVFMSPDLDEAHLKPIRLEKGKAVAVPPNTLHSFLVDEQAHINVVFHPGTLGFEKMLLVMQGTARDGVYKNFSAPDSEEGAMFYAALGELTNTIWVGAAKERLDAFYAAKGADIETRKRELIEKYASDELLRKAAGL